MSKLYELARKHPDLSSQRSMLGTTWHFERSTSNSQPGKCGMHEPDTTGRHVSLLLQILPFSFTDNTRDTLDQEECESKHRIGSG